VKFETAAKAFTDYIKVTRSPGTQRYIRAKINPLVKLLEGEDIESIDKFRIISLISDIRDNNPDISNVSINKYVSILKRVYKYVLEKDIIFDKLPETKKTIKIIEPSIQKKVFEYLEDNMDIRETFRNYVIFKLILDTGLRISELLNLRVFDIDFETNTIHVKITKTKSERYVFFRNTTKKLLERLVVSGTLNSYIFINYKGNKRLTVDNVQGVCFRLEKALGLEMNIRPHKWRHTFATEYLKRGGDLETLRLILGHTSLKTTQIYLHIDRDHLHSEYFKNMTA
jgi:site-specific recombinase XerD